MRAPAQLGFMFFFLQIIRYVPVNPPLYYKEGAGRANISNLMREMKFFFQVYSGVLNRVTRPSLVSAQVPGEQTSSFPAQAVVVFLTEHQRMLRSARRQCGRTTNRPWIVALCSCLFSYFFNIFSFVLQYLFRIDFSLGTYVLFLIINLTFLFVKSQ